MKLFEEGFIERNKKVIITAILIMFISAIIGAGMGYIYNGDKLNFISNAISSNPVNNNVSSASSSISLFIHNFIVDFLTIIGGLVFSIFSVAVTVFNGISIGYVFGFDLKFACSTILPHAIIEYTAGALSLAIAFKLTKIEIDIIKKRNFKNTIKEHNIDFKDILSIFVVMVILLAVAAVIEGHITHLIAVWAYGL